MLELNPELDLVLKQKRDLGPGLARRLKQELMHEQKLALSRKLKSTLE